MNKNAYADGKHDAQHMLGNRNQHNKGSASYASYEHGFSENQPKFVVDSFVLQNCFHRRETADGLIFWRECIKDGFPINLENHPGYIVLYADGQHLHTYNCPDSFL